MGNDSGGHWLQEQPLTHTCAVEGDSRGDARQAQCVGISELGLRNQDTYSLVAAISERT